MYGGAADRSLTPGSDAKNSVISTVMVTKEKAMDQFPVHINRPFVATRVLSILDEVAAKTPTVAQQRIIGDDSPKITVTQEISVPKALVVDDSSTIRKQIELDFKAVQHSC